MRWLDARLGPKLISYDAAIPSDYARQLLGKMAAGESSAAINASIAAIEGLQKAEGDFNSGDATSLNQTIWSVIALNCAASKGFAVNYAKVAAAAYIAAEQDSSGGDWGVDVDSTAYALIALVPYKNAAGYPAKIEKAAGNKEKVDWFLYYNGKMAGTGADHIKLKAGDDIWWDYHDWSGEQKSLPAEPPA